MLKWVAVITWSLALSVMGDVKLPRFSYTSSFNNMPPDMSPHPLPPTFTTIQHYPPRIHVGHSLPPRHPLSLSRFPEANLEDSQQYKTDANVYSQPLRYEGLDPWRQEPQTPQLLQQPSPNQNGYLGLQQPQSLKWSEITVRKYKPLQIYDQQNSNEESYQGVRKVCKGQGWEGEEACIIPQNMNYEDQVIEDYLRPFKYDGSQIPPAELVEEEIRVSEPILKSIPINEESLGLLSHSESQKYIEGPTNNRDAYFNSELFQDGLHTPHPTPQYPPPKPVSSYPFPQEEYTTVEDIDIDSLPAVQYTLSKPVFSYPTPQYPSKPVSSHPTPPYPSQPQSPSYKATSEPEVIEEIIGISPPLFKDIPVRLESVQEIPASYFTAPPSGTNQNFYHGVTGGTVQQENTDPIQGLNIRYDNRMRDAPKMSPLFRGDVTRHFSQKGIQTSESQYSPVYADKEVGRKGLKTVKKAPFENPLPYPSPTYLNQLGYGSATPNQASLINRPQMLSPSRAYSSKGQCQWTGNIRWTYHEECGIPEARWNMTYPSCAGMYQSPISITSDATRARKVRPLVFGRGYGRKMHRFEFVNSGHGLMVNVLHNEDVTLSGGGLPFVYRLVKIIFTSHSLHVVDNSRYPLEIQLYHVKHGLTLGQALHQPNAIAILSIRFAGSHPLSTEELFEAGLSMKSVAPETQALVSTLNDLISVAKEIHRPYERVFKTGIVRLGDLVTEASGGYYAYEGSLAQPPCTERIIWVLQKKVRGIPDETMDSMTSTLHSMLSALNQPVSTNYRQTQPTHGRIVEHWVW